jgi:hypothetical protein
MYINDIISGGHINLLKIVVQEMNDSINISLQICFNTLVLIGRSAQYSAPYLKYKLISSSRNHRFV